MPRTVLLWLLGLSLLSPAGPAFSQELDASQVLQTLATGSLADREAMIARLIETKTTVSSASIAGAVAQELVRVNAEVAERQRKIASGALDPEAPEIGEYLGLLVQACAMSAQPVVLDGLVGAIDTGNMATNAIAAVM